MYRIKLFATKDIPWVRLSYICNADYHDFTITESSATEGIGSTVYTKDTVYCCLLTEIFDI